MSEHKVSFEENKTHVLLSYLRRNWCRSRAVLFARTPSPRPLHATPDQALTPGRPGPVGVSAGLVEEQEEVEQEQQEEEEEAAMGERQGRRVGLIS